ncbi:MAG: Crp/Fnr family transcriptional regulator [Ardenticatenaceae bacterium]|nr:Crp/Fnr family transcriptional regulator [Ardenticatenaceae bacterium]
MLFLQATPLFADIGNVQLKAIAQNIAWREFAPGDIIFHEGDPGQVLYIVGSGQVRIFVNGLDGSETSVILFGRPGEIFGELAVIDGLPRSATAVAMHPTVLYTLSRDDFRKYMQQTPQLALNFMRELSMRVRYNTRQMDSFASLDIPQRLARKLMELAQNYGRPGEKGVHLHVSLTQTDLATLIGATRESTNKSLRDFRKQQWIAMEQGQIIIRDPEALRAAASAQ